LQKGLHLCGNVEHGSDEDYQEGYEEMITDKTRKRALFIIAELRGDRGRPKDDGGNVFPQLPWKKVSVARCLDIANLLEELIT
jgi:hypothetical protein